MGRYTINVDFLSSILISVLNMNAIPYVNVGGIQVPPLNSFNQIWDTVIGKTRDCYQTKSWVSAHSNFEANLQTLLPEWRKCVIPGCWQPFQIERAFKCRFSHGAKLVCVITAKATLDEFQSILLGFMDWTDSTTLDGGDVICVQRNIVEKVSFVITWLRRVLARNCRGCPWRWDVQSYTSRCPAVAYV